MATDTDLLRELHHLHSHSADLERQLKRGPVQIQTAEANAAQAMANVEAARKAIQMKSVAADSKQLQLKEREARIDKLEGNQNAAKNNREYQTLKEQIAADRQANSVLSDEILETLEEIDQDKEKLVQLIENHKRMVADAESIRTRILERRESLLAELKRATDELAVKEKLLAGPLKETYQRVVVGRGEDGMAEVSGQSCGGCYTILSPQVNNVLQMGKSITCTSCGRMLYLGT